jgi:putative endonuclease
MSFLRKEIGTKGEKLAEKYLKKRGFKPVARNFRKQAGELDLLMNDGEDLVIIEVRTVDKSYDYDISDKIPISKRRQLVRVANYLIAELDDPIPNIRFDVCLVTLQPKVDVKHIKDAFQPDDFS